MSSNFAIRPSSLFIIIFLKSSILFFYFIFKASELILISLFLLFYSF